MIFSKLSLGISVYMFLTSHDVSFLSSLNFMSFGSVKRTTVFFRRVRKVAKGEY